jgi:hypothetical protein
MENKKRNGERAKDNQNKLMTKTTEAIMDEETKHHPGAD